MGIVTKHKDISVHIDPISFTADIEVLSGNIAQTYNNDSKEYEPDRSVVPCILMPYVVVSDPEGQMNGKRSITGVEWYEGAPKKDGSNRITNGDDYVISDTDTPTYSLKVKKNVEPNKPLQITAIFTVTDTRKNTEIKFERSVNLYTALYDISNYALSIDAPKSWTIDPLREVADSNGKWLHTITAQLTSGLQKIADENAAYWWQINENNSGWRDITQDELDIYISGKDSEGNWTKALTFDARFIRNTAFRCLSRFYNGERPTSFDPTLSAVSVINVQMPKSLNVQIRQLSGSKINATMTTSVKFECVITDNKQIIGTDKDKFFTIIWKAHSGKAGVTDKEIGRGRTITFIPSSLGFDKNYGISIYAEVKLYAVTALVLRNGELMLKNNKAVTAAKYE